ncbi:protein STICHEL-like [Dorcoceras hygrometricum]|uniref:Protein STICHEL-like n=1 Tax=Dorcoceras hygrometricum TaxID=472368 RepID=A0A2Z6ZU31_9LAMI|nr:protein STICHEL-like [Dorcoceras hygrometricum]
MNQLLLRIQSLGNPDELQYPVAGNPGAKNRKSSKAQQLKNESAAKQLTTYEEFTKDGCQLLSSIQMAKTTRSLQKKRTQVLFPVGTLQNIFEREECCVQREEI